MKKGLPLLAIDRINATINNMGSASIKAKPEIRTSAKRFIIGYINIIFWVSNLAPLFQIGHREWFCHRCFQPIFERFYPSAEPVLDYFLDPRLFGRNQLALQDQRKYRIGCFPPYPWSNPWNLR